MDSRCLLCCTVLPAPPPSGYCSQPCEEAAVRVLAHELRAPLSLLSTFLQELQHEVDLLSPRQGAMWELLMNGHLQAARDVVAQLRARAGVRAEVSHGG